MNIYTSINKSNGIRKYIFALADHLIYLTSLKKKGEKRKLIYLFYMIIILDKLDDDDGGGDI
jgi:hypothetical protein